MLGYSWSFLPHWATKWTLLHGFMFNHLWWFLPHWATRWTLLRGFIFDHLWWFLPHWATSISWLYVYSLLVVFATLSRQNMASEFHMYESQASENKVDVERLSHWFRELIKKYFLQERIEMSVKEEKALIKMMAPYTYCTIIEIWLVKLYIVNCTLI